MQAGIEELRRVIALSNLPDEHLQWIINHSEFIELDDDFTLK